MPEASAFDVGENVFVVDDGLDPVVQHGHVIRNIEQYTSNVKVELDSGKQVGCHPDQVLPEDADGDRVDEFLSIQDRL